jgi:hypothetical protein
MDMIASSSIKKHRQGKGERRNENNKKPTTNNHPTNHATTFLLSANSISLVILLLSAIESCLCETYGGFLFKAAKDSKVITLLVILLVLHQRLKTLSIHVNASLSIYLSIYLISFIDLISLIYSISLIYLSHRSP